MSDSKYPSELDSDLELPRVEDDVSEISGEHINSLISAIFNIEETLGTNPQGTEADLTTRLDESMNANGSLKASALAAAGLVTLPITNSQIASNAGIEESKLDLDYDTADLKAQADALDVFTIFINNRLTQDIANLVQHTGHPATFGRHQTRDIDGYVGDFDGYNLEGIITDINGRLVNHVTDTTDAHDASAVSFDDTTTSITASNTQTALEELDDLQTLLMVQHRDRQHSNGLLRKKEVYLDGYNHSTQIVSGSLASVVAGARSVTFSPVPGALAQVSRGDEIRITISSQTFRSYVDSVSSGVVTYFGVIPFGGTGGTAVIYNSPEEDITSSALILAQRQNNVVQLIHPGAPFILSSGIDARGITATADTIKVSWATGNTGDLDIKTALEAISTSPSVWTPTVVVRALNNLFRSESPSNHFPLIAFTYKNEVGIAFDEAIVDAYVEITAPSSSNSAWSVLGFTEGDQVYGLGPRTFYIDGYGFSSIHTKINTTGTASVNSISSFPAGTDVIGAGVRAGDLLRISGSSTAVDNGSFITDAVSAASIVINEHPGFVADTVNFKIYNDTFGLISAPSNPQFYELFVDGYNNLEARLQAAIRAQYSQTAGFSDDARQVFDIVDISRDFPAATRRIYYDDTSKTLQLGQQGASGTLQSKTEGPAVSLPTSGDAAGFRLRLFDNNRVDYIDVEVASSSYLSYGADTALDVSIFDRISEERYLQVGVVLHNTTTFKHLSDRRLKGNVGRHDVRDDFISDYTTFPTSLLRGNGVIFGFSVQQGTSISGADTIDAYGGQALVDGKIMLLDTKNLIIPQDSGHAGKTYNLFLDSNGFNFLEDDVSNTSFSPPSVAEIIASTDKTMLYQVVVDASNNITNINDFRRFVNNIDNKIELIIEENNITHGSFASLNAAVNWYNNSTGLPVPSVIKVRGQVEVQIDAAADAITIPSGVNLIGDSNENSIINVTNTTTGINAIIPSSYCEIRNLRFQSSSTEFRFVGSANMDDVKIENCKFVFSSGSTNVNQIGIYGIDDNVIVKNCIFDSADFGIVSGVTQISNCVFSDNRFIDPYQSAIDITSGAIRVMINNNIIEKTATAVASKGLINIETTDTTSLIQIKGNIIHTITTSAHAGTGIRFLTVSPFHVNINISNNFITNFNSGGLDVGIYVDRAEQSIVSSNTIDRMGTTAINIDTVNDSSIENNVINNTDTGIIINDCENILVGNNTILDSTVIGISTTGTNTGHITINENSIGGSGTGLFLLSHLEQLSILSNSINVSSYGIFINEAFNCIISNNNILVDGTNQNIIFATVLQLIINGNVIVNDGSGTFNSNLLSGSGQVIIESNYFENNRSSNDFAVEISAAISNNSVITNNIFNITNLTTNVVRIVATGCLIGFNNFTDSSTTAGSMVSSSSDTNSNLMNKGENYSIPISLARAVPDIGTWQVTSGGVKTILFNSAGTNDTAYIEFSALDIPVGATVTSLDISANVSDTSDLTINWRVVDWEASPVGVDLATGVNPSVTGSYSTFNVADTTSVVTNESIYNIQFVTDGTLSGPVRVGGIRVNYTL